MIYKLIEMIYEWHTSKYEWLANDIRVHADDLQTHRNDIRMTCEYIRVAHKWHLSGIRVHTIDIQMIFKLHTNDLRMTWEILNFITDLELSDLIFKAVCGKIISLGGCKWFWLLYCSDPYTFFIIIVLRSTIGCSNLNNLKGDPYYIL